jgi:hypothetical protein
VAGVDGVKIVDLTASGTSDDGEQVWITHRLGDGGEYPLVYPYEAIGYLIAVLSDAARSATERRVARDPAAAVEGADAKVLPVAEVRIGTAPDDAGAILHLTTADGVAIAVELPGAILDDVANQLQHIGDGLTAAKSARRHLH